MAIVDVICGVDFLACTGFSYYVHHVWYTLYGRITVFVRGAERRDEKRLVFLLLCSRFQFLKYELIGCEPLIVRLRKGRAPADQQIKCVQEICWVFAPSSRDC